MKYLTEFRDPALVHRAMAEIRRVVRRPWRIMEVCGGQTHSIVKHDLQSLLPEGVELIHGPGCPVCVTPVSLIDRAVAIARRPDVVFCSYGDMLRVPGSDGDLLTARADGADVRVVYSSLDALALATANPDKEVVMFAVGFETTAPAHAMAVLQAAASGVQNFSLLVAHVLVPPALGAIMSHPECRVDGFLAAGHVCSVMGLAEYRPMAEAHRVPIVVTGFEPVDIADGLLVCLRMLEKGEWGAVNQYDRVVAEGGNPAAKGAVARVFCPKKMEWRGLGAIPESGLRLRPEFDAFDADRKFHEAGGCVSRTEGPRDASPCRAGDVLLGIAKPRECAAFGTACQPDHPLGAPMVSSEGACAAYFKYQRYEEASDVSR
jgi:hydrogenase expression/formation protein HypD